MYFFIDDYMIDDGQWTRHDPKTSNEMTFYIIHHHSSIIYHQ